MSAFLSRDLSPALAGINSEYDIVTITSSPGRTVAASVRIGPMLFAVSNDSSTLQITDCEK